MAIESKIEAVISAPAPAKDYDGAPGQAEPAQPLKKAVFGPLSDIEPDAAGYNLKVEYASDETRSNQLI